ncbi:MAG: hypothetical protein MAG431_00847 [Chloroflexi bacterium]|nr:hypothetical protein [Chloroflexota bacterium]
MTGVTHTQNQLIADLSRDVVVEIAPHETPMFRATSEAYFDNPEKLLESQEGKDDMLGFGSATAATFMTPAVLAVATTVVKFVVEHAKETFEEESEDLLSDIVKKMFKKVRPAEEESQAEEKSEGEEESEPEPASPAKEKSLSLTSEQLDMVSKLAFEQARQLRLSENTAELLAESLVGSLVVTSS